MIGEMLAISYWPKAVLRHLNPSPPLFMSVPVHFLVRPVAACAIEAVDRRRFPRSGPRVDDPRTVQLRSGKTALGMTTRQMAHACRAISPLTR